MAFHGTLVRVTVFTCFALFLLADTDAQTLRNPQSNARPFGYETVSPVYQTGSDARAQRFNTNYLPKVMEIVNERFREGSEFENPGAVPLNVDRMVLNYDYDVRAYFIHEGAGYKNTVGVKLADDHKLLFPDCSYDGAGGVRLQRGDFVNMGLIKKGTKIDLLVVPNGAGGGLGGKYYRLYTTSSLSDDKRQHYVGFWIEDTPLLLFGAEDLLGGGDNDFEDVLVVLDFGLDYDPPKNYYVSMLGNDANTGLSSSNAFRTITKAAQVVRPGDTVYVSSGTYTENPDFRVAGTDLHAIRFIAYGNVVVQSAQENAWLMTMNYADYYIFDGFRFTGKNQAEGVLTYGLYNYHSDVTFRNCQFDSLYYGVHGVYSGTKFDRCRIQDNQGYALLNYFGGLDIKSSEITNNANGPYSYREHFLSIADTKIEDNDGWAMLYAFDPYGTHQPLGVNKPTVSNCIIRNNANGLHLAFGKAQDRINFSRTKFEATEGWEMYLEQCEYDIDSRWRSDWPIDRGGSGLYTNSCKLKLHDVSFDGYTNGWGFLDYYSDLELTNVTVRNNQNGMQTYGSNGFVAKRSEFSNNAGWGLVFYNTNNVKAVVDSCQIDANGNGLYLSQVDKKNFVSVNSTITNNTGHGLYLRESDSEFTPGTMGTQWRLAGNGHGITTWGGKALFDTVTISGNKSWGALTYYGDITVRNSSFTGNGQGLYSYYNKSFSAQSSYFDNNTSYGMQFASDGHYYGFIEKENRWDWLPTNGVAKIQNCTMRNNGNYGLLLQGVKDNTFNASNLEISGNKTAGLYASESELDFNPKTMDKSWRIVNNASHIYALYGKYRFEDLDLSDAQNYAVYTWYSDVTVKNCTFARNGNSGFVSYYNQSLVADNSTFTDNKSWGMYCYHDGRYYGKGQDGVWAWQTDAEPVQLTGCRFEKNQNGLYLYGATDKVIRLTNTPINNNVGHGLYAVFCDLTFSPSTLGERWQIKNNGYGITAYYGKTVFDHVDITGSTGWGALTYYGDVVARNSNFRGNGTGGLQSYYNRSFLAKNCEFTENGSWGVSYYADGHYYGLVDGEWKWSEGATPGKFDTCSIANNTNHGMYVGSTRDDMLVMTNTPIRDNPGHGLYAVSSDLKFTKDTVGSKWQIKNNGYGITTYYGKTLFDGVEIADNKGWGALTYYGDVTVRNSTFARNGTGGLQAYYNKSFRAEDSTFTENGSWGTSYYSDGRYYGLVADTWQWNDGATPGEYVNCQIIGNASNGMHVGNSTNATLRLTNTSIQNNPGHGLYAVSCNLKLTPETVGKNWIISNNGHGITNYYGSMLLDGVTIADNTGWGVLSYYADTVVTNSTFTRNGSGGLHSYYDKSFAASGSRFNENGSWGFYCYNDGRYYGLKDGVWDWYQGAAPAKIANCDFSRNTSHGVGFDGIKDDRIEMTDSQATENGAIGIYFANSTVTLSPATAGKWVSKNNVHGFHASNSDITVEDFEISGNSQWGMYTYYSNVSLKNAKFSGNGHNMYWYASPWTHGWNTKLTVDNCIFENSTEHHGLLTYYGPVEIKNSIFRNNKGDGLYTVYNKSAKVENCEMTGNGRWGVVYHVNYPQENEWEQKELFKENVQTLSACKVAGNYQGIFVYNAAQNQFDVVNSSITDNQYQSVYYNRCNLVVDHKTANVTIANNGHGPYVGGGSDVVFRNVVNQNSRDHGFLNSQSKVSLEHCVSTGSLHGYYQYLPTAPTVLTGNRFEGSTKNGNGWGILSYGGSVDSTNNLFTGFYGGAYLYTYGTETTVPVHNLYNNTIANVSYWGVYAPNGTASIHNNVITHVASDGGTPTGYGIGHADAQLAHSHNLIHGFAAPFYRTTDANDTTILKEPRFADAAAGDYHLGKGSPAINAGLDTSAIVPYDMEGNARPSFKVVEIGAYEYTNPGGAFRVVEWKENK
jgi:hypothetical protein